MLSSNKKQEEYRKKLLEVLPDSDTLTQCMHCGMCLAVCPTYEKTKNERSSPRGRIRLIKSVAEEKLPVTENFINEINFCLDCQACETACPAGVHYGHIVETARELTTILNRNKSPEIWIRKIALNNILADKFIFKYVSKLLFIVQKLKLDKFFANLKITNLFIQNAGELLKLLPEFSSKSSEELLPTIIPPKGEKKFRVAFLTGCLMDTAFTETNLETVELLTKLGCEVIIPKNQVCCGSLHAHNGEMQKSVELARKNLTAFSKYEYDFLVSNSAGCGAFMKEYAKIFKNEPELSQKAEKFSKKVQDITEFLSNRELNYTFKEFNKSVTYHDACHLCHTQKIVNEPREIIKSIPAVDYRPLEDSTWCCGSAGIYNVLRYEDSMHFLDRKIERIQKTGAEVVVTGNPGCFLQLRYGLQKKNVNCTVEHTASFLNKLL
ncbi:MAG: (Fe-S)-binding protein [Ignavibacteria bacterium]|nr:(Fe-S)-binding protein [Ignavibacteria bacterium]